MYLFELLLCSGLPAYNDWLVGLSADSTYMNSSIDRGVQELMKVEMPNHIYVWCMVYQFELALKDAQRETSFSLWTIF